MMFLTLAFRWSLDERVYEGVLEKLDLKRKNATIRFIGYDNVDTVALDQLFASKGEDWREGQQHESEQAEKGPAAGVDGQPPPPDLRLFSAKECQDLLAQLGHGVNKLKVGEEVEEDVVVERTVGRKKKTKKLMEMEPEEKKSHNRKKTASSSDKSRRAFPSEGTLTPPSGEWVRESFTASFVPPPLPPSFSSSKPLAPPLPSFTSSIPLPPLVPPLPPLSGTVPAFLPPPPALSTEDMDFIHANSEVREELPTPVGK